jgi:SNF2 family DNA or RNA helicase
MIIEEAAFYGLYDDNTEVSDPQTIGTSSLEPAGQPKRPASPDRAAPNKRRRGGTFGTFTEWMSTSISFDDNDASEDECDRDSGNDESASHSEEEVSHAKGDGDDADWITEFGKSMPGAKFDVLREQVKQWFEEDSTAKVVIFTQYINSAKILRYLCEQNGWKYSRVSSWQSYAQTELYSNMR